MLFDDFNNAYSQHDGSVDQSLCPENGDDEDVSAANQSWMKSFPLVPLLAISTLLRGSA